MGVILIALVISSVITSWTIGMSPEEGIQRLGCDLPDALYPYRPGESSNRYRISIVPEKDFERIEIQSYWLSSKPIPNSTKPGAEPTTDEIDTLLAMIDQWSSGNIPIKAEVEYNGSKAELQLYDFSNIHRLSRTPLENFSSCYVFILDQDSSIMGYYEGFSDFFPLPGSTISLLRLTRTGTTEEFGHTENRATEKSIEEAPLYGLWTVEKPRRNEVLEMTVLLTENAGLLVKGAWSEDSEKMLIVSTVVDGERYPLWLTFA